ncbi:hypothetical protein K488DRAFT_70932 [Vararia minispora EC-137]|uniref:Uncharacterized protein n=1 Tax=Vararia minispora EC-137 TaxID=1314806 RepID=A0ACB8QJP1_9AGAM|nr:hypothetical protein K488DRAFT_70932 [Vararia minispora EC-137]
MFSLLQARFSPTGSVGGSRRMSERASRIPPIASDFVHPIPYPMTDEQGTELTRNAVRCLISMRPPPPIDLGLGGAEGNLHQHEESLEDSIVSGIRDIRKAKRRLKDRSDPAYSPSDLLQIERAFTICTPLTLDNGETRLHTHLGGASIKRGLRAASMSDKALLCSHYTSQAIGTTTLLPKAAIVLTHHSPRPLLDPTPSESPASKVNHASSPRLPDRQVTLDLGMPRPTGRHGLRLSSDAPYFELGLSLRRLVQSDPSVNVGISWTGQRTFPSKVTSKTFDFANDQRQFTICFVMRAQSTGSTLPPGGSP